jgi:hypothetical protein
VPNGQAHQQGRDTKVARLPHPRNRDGSRNEFTLDR